MKNEPKITDKEDFIKIYKEKITRDGSDKLLEFLEKSDFFTAPASTRYHGAYEGGLLRHSLNVYECLTEYLVRERVREKYGLNVSDESAAIAALLHDICKVNFYTVAMRNAKNEQTGQWEKVPYYTINDTLPYGHGEKSVYMISGFMRLTREEAMAIRWHMGFSGIEDKNTIGKALEMYPLAFALSVADMEASYFLEGAEGK
ncbi:MAG: HD domain-containing protein [Oscillospiraceae bacterium]|nr:HD domain-containing protein [Oscillospiraceae bacterium]